jgi:acyl-CoA thioesterase I
MSVVHRLWTTLLLTATAVVAGGVVYVVGHSDPVPSAGSTPGYSAPPVSAPASSGVAVTMSPSGVRTVFLGDDYTAGVGASSAKAHWTTLVAGQLGLEATVVASAGAGYATHGHDGKSYRDLVAAVVAAKPQLVVVSGGRNDTAIAARRLRAATQAVFAELHTQLPDAAIVAIAPWWGDSAHPAKLTPVDAAVKAAVTSEGGRYLDIADPLVDHHGWMAGEADPNDQGYQAIAASVEPALRAVLPRT